MTHLSVISLEDRTTPTTFTVTTPADAGAGSLRQAILDANTAAGADDIAFNLPGAGGHTIQLASQLPLLTGAVNVDGYTQPGSSPNTLAIGDNAVITVEIAGGGGAAWAFAQQPGFDISGSTFRGLSLGGFTSTALAIGTANNVTVAGNFIGLRPDGVTGRANGGGLSIEAGSGHVVGGSLPANRNVISGNTGNGVSFTASGVQVLGNYIGTTASGAAKLGNTAAGVTFQSSNNLISGNLISGNGTAGIWARNAAAITITGNRIGLDTAGNATLGNGQDGVLFTAALNNSIIGGTAAASGNVISGNGGNGITFESSSTNAIEGNLIGTNVGFGVSASGIISIGGTASVAGNVVSGNGAGGLHLVGAFTALNNHIENNSGPGVLCDGASGGNLGNEAAPNAIASNSGPGVVIQFPSTHYRVSANSIHDNGGPGIDLVGDSNNLIKPPTFTSVSITGDKLRVLSPFNGPAGDYRVEYFANPPGTDEGRLFLGSTTFSFRTGDPPIGYLGEVPAPPAGFPIITATLTNEWINCTSEFSAPYDSTIPPNTAPTISDIANQFVPPGSTSAPISFQISDAESAADALVITVSSTLQGVVPLSGIVLGGSGANRTVTITPTLNPGKADSTTITLTVTDPAGASASESFAVSTRPPTTTGSANVRPGNTSLLNNKKFAIGPDRGGLPDVQFRDQAGSVLFSKRIFDVSQTGGVRTVAGDVNCDGYPDLICAAGPGGPPTVVIIDGKTGNELRRFDAFERSFTGGLFVTTADFDQDGCDDVVITPDEGGGPRVMVRSGKDDHTMADFFGIDDPNFRGGCRAAASDVSGDGVPDLLVAAGFGGGPRLAGFDGKSIAAGSPTRIFADFFVFEQALRNGVYVTAGDINADGYADVIAGGGPGGGPRVLALNGKRVMENVSEPLANFFAGDPNSRGGVRLAIKDLDNDVQADLVTAAGSGDGSTVRRYIGKGMMESATPTPAAVEDAFPGFNGGVFVG